MKKKAVFYGIFAGLIYLGFQLFFLEKITPVPESIGYYKWFIYSFVAFLHGVIGYYWSVFHFFKKQQTSRLAQS